VVAVEKRTGHALWTTELPGALGDNFVTLLIDGPGIFAHSNGHLYGIDIDTGKIIWTNELPGCGYGLASLSDDRASAPDPALIRAIEVARSASSSGGND
jgi:outer membrane protein assembly factor BamB